MPETSRTRLLIPWLFTPENLPDNCEGNWYGLFMKGKNSAVIEETMVTVRGMYDIPEGPDGPGDGYESRYVQKTVNGKPVQFDYMEVGIDSDQEPLILIRGVDGLKSGPVPTAFAGDISMEPEESVDLSMETCGSFALSAEGRVIPRTSDVDDYILRLESDDKTQVLANFKHCNGSIPRLRWAGDLDGDGKLDLYVYMTNDMYSAAETLFLSSMAGEGELVGKAAELWIHGD